MTAAKKYLSIPTSMIAIGLNGCLAFVMSIQSVNLCDAGQAREANGNQIVSVTVYRNQARVVREIKIPDSAQRQVITVADLPAKLLPKSVFTESDASTVVQSLEVVSPSDENDEQAVDAIEKLNAARLATVNDVAIIEQDLLTLEKLVSFSAGKFQHGLAKSSLNVKSVTELADFTMVRRRKLAAELFAKRSEIRLIDHKLAALEFSPASDPVNYDARISVTSANGGWVRLTYHVADVNWTPRYQVNGKEGQDQFDVRLDGLLTQNSGEDWRNVSLTLATSTPNSQASGPSLTPLRINSDPSLGSNASSDSSQRSATNQWIDSDYVAKNVRLNTQAGLQQIDEMITRAEVQRKIAPDAGVNATDEVYRIAQKVSLSSSKNPQAVAILTTTMTGKPHRVVTPLLSSFAFCEASLLNKSGQNLIAGPASVYLDEQFVGRIKLPPTASGQKMLVGFGTDRQVRTRRELLSRDESIKGGNRILNLKYRLVVSNFHETPIAIRLLDRMPVSSKDDSINVTLMPAESKRLSTDPLYLRMQRPTGILRWDLEIPARQFGSDAFDHEYQFSIEHDRKQTIFGKELQQRIEADLRFNKTNMGSGMGGGGMF